MSGESTISLQARMLKLRPCWDRDGIHLHPIYIEGHKEARYYAADIALKADACMAALRDILAQFGDCREDGADPACGPLSIEKIKVAREALAALDQQR